MLAVSGLPSESQLPQGWPGPASGACLPDQAEAAGYIDQTVQTAAWLAVQELEGQDQWPSGRAQDVTAYAHLTVEGRGGKGIEDREREGRRRTRRGGGQTIWSAGGKCGRWPFAICMGRRAQVLGRAQSCADTSTEPSQHTVPHTQSCSGTRTKPRQHIRRATRARAQTCTCTSTRAVHQHTGIHWHTEEIGELAERYFVRNWTATNTRTEQRITF
jgi:hypothetical protein